MRVVPVAGRDSMLLNLSGAHAPFFTRNVVILTDETGRTGVSEVPGGERIHRTLEEARELVLGIRSAPGTASSPRCVAASATATPPDAGRRRSTSGSPSTR